MIKLAYPLAPFPPSPSGLRCLQSLPKTPFPQNLRTQSSQIWCLALNQRPDPFSSAPAPPVTREEAILQARSCLSLSLRKPLANPRSRLRLPSGKQKQPRLQIEVPLLDDSPGSLSQLALQIFSHLSIQKAGDAAPVRFLILWPNRTLLESALDAFESSPQCPAVRNLDLISAADSADARSAADVAVFFAPEASQSSAVKAVADLFRPRPVVAFNPEWGGLEPSELGGFVGSFEVVYSVMGLEARGILSRKKGVVFRCAGSGEGWGVWVEDEEGRQMKLISRFKRRPSAGEVESFLYNLMAANSPVTKSVKFLRDLVLNATGKGER